MKTLKTPLDHFKGLMFVKRENAEPLKFVFNKPTMMKIHSYFVRFPFLACFYDENDKLVGLRYILQWRMIKPRKKYKTLIEIPC